MALPWFKVTADLINHPKLVDLEERLPGVDGVGIVVRMWAWLSKYAPGGKLTEKLALQLAGAALRGYHGEAPLDPAEALRALIDSGFVDRLRNAPVTQRNAPPNADSNAPPNADSNAYEAHDWAFEQGAHQTKAEQNRERQRKFRERKKDGGIASGNAGNALRNGEVTPQSRLEEKREEKGQGRNAQPGSTAGDPTNAATTPPPGPEKTGSLGNPWDPRELAALREALGKTDLDPDWQRFLGQALRYPAAQRSAAVGAFLQRPPEERQGVGPSYVLRMIQGGAQPRAAKPQQRQHDERPPIPNYLETRARLDEQRALAAANKNKPPVRIADLIAQAKAKQPPEPKP